MDEREAQAVQGELRAGAGAAAATALSDFDIPCPSRKAVVQAPPAVSGVSGCGSGACAAFLWLPWQVCSAGAAVQSGPPWLDQGVLWSVATSVVASQVAPD